MIATPHEMYRNSSLDTSALPVRTVEEVISEAGEKVPWVIENLAARGAVTDCSGLAKKGGKTTFWCHAIAAGARGEDHAGFATEPAKYLYLTEQGNNFAEALRRSGLEEHPDRISIVQFKDVSAVGWERLIQSAGAEAKRRNLDALIVDTFTVFARLKGSEENESGVIDERMRVLNLVAQRYNIGVVLIRHAGKDGTPRGSSAFEGVADICVTIARPEGRHALTVRKIAGVGRYGEWERNIELTEGGYISLGTDDKLEFRKAVRFAKAVLPASPQSGMKKQEMLDKREGDDKNITARTLDRALAWLVEQGDVGEKQLMNQRGRPKVYWLAYKPPGISTGVSTKPHHTHTGFGENKPNGGSEDTEIYSRQTLSNTYDGGENKLGVDNNRQASFSRERSSEQKSLSDRQGVVVELQADNISSSLAPRSGPPGGTSLCNRSDVVEETFSKKCIHGFVGGKGCYLHDSEHPYRKRVRGEGA
jgi:hypothetical protein